MSPRCLETDRYAPRRRWRDRRDLLIFAARERCGFSHQYLADVFRVARSTIPDVLGRVSAWLESSGLTLDQALARCRGNQATKAAGVDAEKGAGDGPGDG